MKSFSERNTPLIGAIGVAAVAAIVLAALNFQKLPFLNQANEYSAYFADAGGLHTGASVDVSGFRGKCPAWNSTGHACSSRSASTGRSFWAIAPRRR